MTDRHDDAARDLVRRAHHSDPEPADLDIRAGLADVLARGGQQAPNRTQPAGEATQPSVRAALAEDADGATTSAVDLLLRADHGDPVAWEEIVRRYSPLVRSTVASFRLQEADAENAVQNTWLRLVERIDIDEIRAPERLGGWLATTASRECLHILRGAADPEQRVIDADIARTLEKLVEELSPSRRTLVRELFSATPRPYAEAARAAGIPPGAIGPTRARARRQLRERLAERGLTAETTARKTSESDSPSVPRGHREALLDGARRCLLERGYAGTTARDLVAASGTNLASIGYHFGSKEALLIEAMQQCFDEYNEQIAQIAFADPSATPLQQVQASWEALVSTFDQYRPLMVVFVEALAQAERVPELQAQLAECYERLRTTVADMVHTSADGLSDASARQVASFLIATYNGLHVQWLLDPECAPTPTHQLLDLIPQIRSHIELKLTPQELRVALAIQRGLTNTNVAAELFLSVKTVEFHLNSIYRKLGIRSRTQLIRVLNECRTT